MDLKQTKALFDMNMLDFEVGVSDPSQADGFQIIYEKELQFEIRIQQRESTNTLLNQMLNLKLLVEGDLKNPKALRIELTSDSDLFFNFHHSINELQFKLIKQKQNFYIQFRQYPSVILKNLQKVEKDRNAYVLIFTIFTDFEGSFNIIQKTQFKNYEILSFDFKKSSDEFIRRVIKYRYQVMKARIQAMEVHLTDIKEQVKVKNPSLSLQIQKKLPYESRRQ